MDRSARVIAKSLPPMPDSDTMPGLMQGVMKSITALWREPTPLLSELNAADGLRLAEVVQALRGQAASAQRQSEEGGDILTVAVPVQGYRAIVGALMVSTRPGEIDALLAEERRLILQLCHCACRQYHHLAFIGRHYGGAGAPPRRCHARLWQHLAEPAGLGNDSRFIASAR